MWLYVTILEVRRTFLYYFRLFKNLFLKTFFRHQTMVLDGGEDADVPIHFLPGMTRRRCSILWNIGTSLNRCSGRSKTQAIAVVSCVELSLWMSSLDDRLSTCHSDGHRFFSTWQNQAFLARWSGRHQPRVLLWPKSTFHPPRQYGLWSWRYWEIWDCENLPSRSSRV